MTYRPRSIEYTDRTITMRNVRGNVRERVKVKFIVEHKWEDGVWRDCGYGFKSFALAATWAAKRNAAN